MASYYSGGWGWGVEVGVKHAVCIGYNLLLYNFYHNPLPVSNPFLEVIGIGIDTIYGIGIGPPVKGFWGG